MRDKEIKLYSFEDDETGICPFDGEACPRQRRCILDVRALEYDFAVEILSIRGSLCSRVPRIVFERLATEVLQRRIGELDDIREYLLELSRRPWR